VEKTYPPNTTLIATVATDCGRLTAYGDIKKLIVMENLGGIIIGNYPSSSHIEEVVVKSTSKDIELWSSVGNLEVQEQQGEGVISVWNDVTNHIDIRNIGKSARLELMVCNATMDLWVGENCGLIRASCLGTAWRDYVNNDCGGRFFN